MSRYLPSNSDVGCDNFWKLNIKSASIRRFFCSAHPVLALPGGSVWRLVATRRTRAVSASLAPPTLPRTSGFAPLSASASRAFFGLKKAPNGIVQNSSLKSLHQTQLKTNQNSALLVICLSAFFDTFEVFVFPSVLYLARQAHNLKVVGSNPSPATI